MISIREACNIALKEMTGYHIVSALEIDDGWLFTFEFSEGGSPDISPIFVNKGTGKIQTFIFEDHLLEILTAKPVELSKI